MRVICIENSILIDKNHPNFGCVMTHKGSIYTVINTIDGEQLRKNTRINFASGVWYEFLELQGLHHHIRFLEIPEDDVEVEIEKKQHNILNTY